MEFHDFPYIGNFIIPTDEVHHFSEGPSLQVDYAWDFDDFGRPVSLGFVILGSPKSD
jgi:hypothetical protein